jgi:hypothetical protein
MFPYGITYPATGPGNCRQVMMQVRAFSPSLAASYSQVVYNARGFELLFRPSAPFSSSRVPLHPMYENSTDHTSSDEYPCDRPHQSFSFRLHGGQLFSVTEAGVQAVNTMSTSSAVLFANYHFPLIPTDRLILHLLR